MKISETEIGNAVMDYLARDGWDCYPEAQFDILSNRADIAAVKGGMLLIVECKTSCNMSLFEQAYKWRHVANLVAIAHPSRQTRSDNRMIETHLLSELGLGRFEVSKLSEESIPHVVMRDTYKYYRSKSAGKYIAGLHEDMKCYTPGSQTEHGFSTAWSRTMKMVKNHIINNPGTTIKEVMTLSDQFHYSSRSGARQCLRKWLDADKEIVVKRGKEYRYYHKEGIGE